ncbi:MAG TPA: tail fiber domain-containing protein, partial [Alphaproteobacteria bacterium]
AVTTAKVGDDQVTFAKMQNIATNRLLGRVTAGSGDVEELTIGSGLTITGTTISVATGSGVGDVVGPASATDNAIARYDGTTGKLIQNSGVTIGDAGETNITSASANALTVGPNGTTNPVLQVDGSTASSATGIKVTGAAAGSGVTLGVISSNTDENLIITSKGGGSVISLRPGNSQTLGLSTASSAFTPTANAAAATVRFRFTGAADSNLTADTESPSVYFNSGQTRQHIAAAGAYAVQRDFRITPSTHSFDAADTITKAAALSVDGAPLGGTNATIITSTAIDVPARVLTNVTNGYGLDITQPTGATSNNSAAYFHGDAANSVNVILENDSTTSDKSELFFVNGTSAGGWGIGTDYAGDKGDNFYIWGGGSGASRMYINAAGTVAIGGNHTSPSASALLDLSSSSRGFLPPRMGDPTTAISSPAEGLLAYNTTTHKLMIRNNTTWSEVGAGSAVASGAAGYIQFSNGSGNLASSGTSAGQQFFWDNTNYRLGIGLTAPTQALDVVGKITTNSMIMKVVTGASAPSNGSGGIWSTSGSNVFLTTSTNKLGIGTNAPATALEVAGPRIRVTNATDPGIELSNGSGVVGYLFYDTTGGDYIGLRHASANPQLVLKNTGNVGIGTTSPGEKLHVVGTVKTDTADAAKAVIMRNSTNGGEWSFRLQGNGTTANNLNVDYGVSNFMTVASSGNVGIGTNTPGSRLDVKQVGTSDDNIRLVDDNTVNYWGMSFNNSTLTFRYNTTDRVSVANSGNMTVVGAGTTCVIGSGTGATNCTSDVRLKTDIKPIENALSKLLAIDGVTFEWKDPEKTKGPHLGVIAQAVEKVFPEAVIEVDDKALGKAKAVDYAVLVAPIIEAIKEIKHALDDLVGKVTELFDIVGNLKMEIAELKAENAELKTQNTDIIKRLEALEAKEQ